jgi:hypothetical protein
MFGRVAQIALTRRCPVSLSSARRGACLPGRLPFRDCFGFMELLQWVEHEFSVSVADDELVPDNFDSVRKLSSFILGKQSGGA